LSDPEIRKQPTKDVSYIGPVKDLRARERVLVSSTDERGMDYGEARQMVPGSFFAMIASSLADAMGPMASVVLKEHVERLGESIAKFPSHRVPDLIAAIRREILSEHLRSFFDRAVSEQMQDYGLVAAPPLQRK
jgi:hypothetical protein